MIVEALTTLYQEKGFKFKFRDKIYSPEEIFRSNGYLPKLIMHCQGDYEYALSKRLPVSFRNVEEGILGQEVLFDQEVSDHVILLMFLYDKLLEWENEYLYNDDEMRLPD